MICRCCEQDKPETPEYWYYRSTGKRSGKVCKVCQRGGVLIIPICHHCGEPILDDKGEPVDAQTNYHTDRNHEPCYQAKRLKHLHDMRVWDRAHNKKSKDGLSACKAKKKRRRVAKDLMELYGHLDGDWIYC